MISTEPSKLIFYRGWPAGEERPDLAALKKENEHTSHVKGLETISDDENNSTDDDDFGIDAWNEEDWEEAEEDDEDEDVEYEEGDEEEEEEQAGDNGTGGQWINFSGEESDYTDTDLDELVAAISQDATVEENSNQNSDNKE